MRDEEIKNGRHESAEDPRHDMNDGVTIGLGIAAAGDSIAKAIEKLREREGRVDGTGRPISSGGNGPLIMGDTGGTGHTLKCKGKADMYSEQSATGTCRRIFATDAEARKGAINEAENKAKEKVQTDLQRQWNEYNCQTGCVKTPLPDPLSVAITSPGGITKVENWGIYIYYEASATASASATVWCLPPGENPP